MSLTPDDVRKVARLARLELAKKCGFLGASTQSVNHANQVAPQVTASSGTKAYGAELETTWLVTDNDKVTFGISYEQTKIGKNAFEFPVCYNWGTASHPVIQMQDGLLVNQTANIAACSAKNLAANPSTVNWIRYRGAVSESSHLFSAPVWNGNVGYQHVFDLMSGATVTAGVNVHFESSKNTATAYYYDGVNPAFHLAAPICASAIAASVVAVGSTEGRDVVYRDVTFTLQLAPMPGLR